MSSHPQAPVAPPGWYFDQANQTWRWWDGWRWLPTAPAPPDPNGPAAPTSSDWFPTTPTVGLPAAILGVVFIVATTAATRLSELLPETAAATAGLVLFGLSTVGMPLVAWYGSHRWGTGNLVHDLGLRFRWIDLLLGLAGGIALTIALVIVTITSRMVGVPSGSNLTEVAEQGRDGALFVVLFVTAVIVAPLTEELVFRGLIQRGLTARWNPWIATGLQALVFGAAHLTPTEGWGNVDLIVSLAVMGFGLGLFARLTGRLGTSMLAHAVFNAIQLTLLWVSLG